MNKKLKYKIWKLRYKLNTKLKLGKRKCYGKQDSNIAISFPYDCSKCKDQEACFYLTFENIKKCIEDRYP